MKLQRNLSGRLPDDRSWSSPQGSSAYFVALVLKFEPKQGAKLKQEFRVRLRAPAFAGSVAVGAKARLSGIRTQMKTPRCLSLRNPVPRQEGAKRFPECFSEIFMPSHVYQF
jgi:hypothetical protein